MPTNDTQLIGIIGNTDKERTPDAVRRLVLALEHRGVLFLLDEHLVERWPELGAIGPAASLEEIRSAASIVVAFGGDGTMLSVGRLLAGSGIPLVGFNLGRLGFLAEFSVDAIEQTLDDLLADRCRVVERTLLEATFPGLPAQEPLVGLNDIVIDKRDGALMLRLETRINGDLLGTYSADGLVIASPTGSTAYALAVGGPVVAPNAAVTVIAPIAPHMLTARPVVVPDHALIEVRASTHRHEEFVRVYADGQDVRHIPMGSPIHVTRHPHAVRLVKRTSTTYFDVLRAKLLWGREPILEEEHQSGRQKGG